MSEEHPEQQDWMEWLYGECDTDRKREMQNHLSDCESCRGQVTQWRRVMNILDEGNLDSPDLPANVTGASEVDAVASFKDRTVPMRFLLVLAASILVAAIGGAWSVSLFAGDAVNRNQVRQEVLQEVRAELLDLVRLEMEEERPDERNLVPLIQDESGRIIAAELAGWAQQDSQRTQQLQHVLRDVLRNQITLRHDLETLAMEAEAQILQTRRELVRVRVDSVTNPQDESPLPERVNAERY